MLQRAKIIMEQIGAAFIFTGEVVGQRPKSQHKHTLFTIERESGLKGFLLRPLSAKLLPVTIPEQKEWVNRERLLDFQGRGRTAQVRLAKEFNIMDYPWPQGGCLLTEPTFSARVGDLLRYTVLTMPNVELLKYGRHFRLTPAFKLIVGRDEKDNEAMRHFIKPGDLCIEPKDLPGPLAIGRGDVDEEIKKLSAKIVARYVNSEEPIGLRMRIAPGGDDVIYTASGLDDKLLSQFRIV